MIARCREQERMRREMIARRREQGRMKRERGKICKRDIP